MEHFTIELRLPLLVDDNTPPEDILVRAREELKMYGCPDCMGTGVLASEDFDIRTPAGDHVLTPTLPQGKHGATLATILEAIRGDMRAHREAADKLRAALELWATGDYMRADIWEITNAARAAHENAKG